MPSNDVVVCTWDETAAELSSGTQEALTLGRKISQTLGGELRLLALGAASADIAAAAGSFGVATVDHIEDAKLAEFTPDVWTEAVAQYCAKRSPKLLLMNQRFDARLVAPRVAARLDAGVVMNGVDLELDVAGNVAVTTAAFGGDTRTVYTLSGAASHVVALNDNACEPAASGGLAATTDTVAVDLSKVSERIRVIDKPKAEGPKLEDAQVIVAGGRGLGSPENYRLVEELAAALGGVAGASRPIVDDGWTDSSHQVGLTGKITKPALYVAAGISGASQHMVGCSAAKTIVAINTDPDAAIFRHARYGIVGNCLELLPEITRAVKS
jgi:electron transfer flavoprotein alpha subunit